MSTMTLETRTAECPTHGAFESTHLRAATVDMGWSKCPRCLEEQRDLAAVEEARAKARAERDARLDAAHIPARFTAARLDNYTVATEGQATALRLVRDYVEQFDTHAAAGRCMVFCGTVGNGKTHLASAATHALVERGKRVRYTTVAEMIRHIRATWSGAINATEHEVLRYYRDLDLLVLDELGVQSGSENELTLLYDVLGARYNAMRPSLVIGNCDRQALQKYLGERLSDRLRENGGFAVVFNWPSYRGSKA